MKVGMMWQDHSKTPLAAKIEIQRRKLNFPCLTAIRQMSRPLHSAADKLTPLDKNVDAKLY